MCRQPQQSVMVLEVKTCNLNKINHALTKYLQTQNLLGPGVWIGILANALNALFNWLLIYAMGWGLVGAPWATSLTRLAEFLIILLFMLLKKNSLKDTWPVFSRINMQYSVLKPYWKLAITGAISLSAEAWSFEITTILAGLLGTVALDAHMIVLSCSSFLYLSFPFAVGIATSIRVGQLIGEQKPLEAQRSSYTSFLLCAIIQLVLIAIIVPCRDFLGDLFSSDEEVAHLVSQLLPIQSVFLMGNAFLSWSGGVLRGLGSQRSNRQARRQGNPDQPDGERRWLSNPQRDTGHVHKAA
jgi:MATE family multidrug resistance protein